jgi:MinD-like ATPase involved in chromosome partitioning or flagellar assembly
MREPTVVLAHSFRGWAQELHFFLMDHGGAIVRGYVMSPDDALSETYDVFMVDDTTSYLNHRLVSSLRGRGVRVIGVYDPLEADGSGKQMLMDLGVDEALPSSTPPPEVLQVIVRLAGPFLDDDPELAGLIEQIGGRRPAPLGTAAPEPLAGSTAGRVIAVAAAAGGAGATEVAIALAGRIRDHGIATALVDADEQAPAIAQRLGISLHPNVRTAVDVLHHGSGELDAALTRYSAAGLDVLCGLPNPRDWYELRAGEVAEVIVELSRSGRSVVANVGPRVDDLPQLGGPPRFAVTRAAIGLSDAVVLVGTASPVGARRVVDWLADARDLVAGTPVHLVVNHYPGGTFAVGELEAELRRTLTPRSVTVAPHDKRVLRAAWNGEPVAKGPFLRAMTKLAATVAPGGGVGG